MTKIPWNQNNTIPLESISYKWHSIQMASRIITFMQLNKKEEKCLATMRETGSLLWCNNRYSLKTVYCFIQPIKILRSLVSLAAGERGKTWLIMSKQHAKEKRKKKIATNTVISNLWLWDLINWKESIMKPPHQKKKSYFGLWLQLKK